MASKTEIQLLQCCRYELSVDNNIYMQIKDNKIYLFTSKYFQTDIKNAKCPFVQRLPQRNIFFQFSNFTCNLKKIYKIKHFSHFVYTHKAQDVLN